MQKLHQVEVSEWNRYPGSNNKQRLQGVAAVMVYESEVVVECNRVQRVQLVVQCH